MNATILSAVFKLIENNTSLVYLVGVLIALIVLGYLVYTLVRPEKF